MNYQNTSPSTALGRRSLGGGCVWLPPRRVAGPALPLVRSWVTACAANMCRSPLFPTTRRASAGDGAVLHWEFIFLPMVGCRFAPSVGLHGSAVDQDEAHQFAPSLCAVKMNLSVKEHWWRTQSPPRLAGGEARLCQLSLPGKHPKLPSRLCTGLEAHPHRAVRLQTRNPGTNALRICLNDPIQKSVS